MKKPEELLEMALNKIRNFKKLNGEFLVGKGYEQGPLPIQRCTVLSVYYREGGKNILLYRWRACTNGDNLEDTYEEAYSETLSNLILNWDEIWNLINTKPQ